MQEKYIIHLYERDASPTAREQGYNISLRADMGLKALNEFGFLNELDKISIRQSEEITFVNSSFNPLLQLVSKPESPYYSPRFVQTIDRKATITPIPYL